MFPIEFCVVHSRLDPGKIVPIFFRDATVATFASERVKKVLCNFIGGGPTAFNVWVIVR